VISGHSLGVVPMNADDGNLLRDGIPIWSDARPTEQQTKPFLMVIICYFCTSCHFLSQYIISKIISHMLFKVLPAVCEFMYTINLRLNLAGLNVKNNNAE